LPLTNEKSGTMVEMVVAESWIFIPTEKPQPMTVAVTGVIFKSK
jgi:hypothetical protein